MKVYRYRNSRWMLYPYGFAVIAGIALVLWHSLGASSFWKGLIIVVLPLSAGLVQLLLEEIRAPREYRLDEAGLRIIWRSKEKIIEPGKIAIQRTFSDKMHPGRAISLYCGDFKVRVYSTIAGFAEFQQELTRLGASSHIKKACSAPPK